MAGNQTQASERQATSRADMLADENRELRRTVERWRQQQDELCRRLHEDYRRQLAEQAARHRAEIEARNLEIAQLRRQLAVYEHADQRRNQADSFAGDRVEKKKKKASRKRQGHGKGGRRKEPELPRGEDKLLDATPPVCCDMPMRLIRELRPRWREEIEAVVTAVVRRIGRARGVYRCACCGQEKIVEAAAPVRPIAGKYSLLTCVQQLVDHIRHQIPVHRLARRLRDLGLTHISDGTLCDIFRKLAELLADLDRMIIEKCQSADTFALDCSGLPIREEHPRRQNLESRHWPLWQIRTAVTAVFMLTVRQSTDELLAFFAPMLDRIATDGPFRVMADRAKNIRVLEHLQVMVAFCWVHVRRDFIKLGRSDKQYLDFARQWVNHIRIGFRCHERRQRAGPGTKAWQQADARLRQHVDQLKQTLQQQLADPTLPECCRRLLHSMDEHWQGLTLFLDHLVLPMHNNDVERGYRWLAIFRRISFSCHNEMRAQDRARFYTIFQTLELNHINAVDYLVAFLSEQAKCRAENRPMPLLEWQPWQLSERVRQLIAGT